MTQEEKQLLLKDLCARLPYYTELHSNATDDNWAILTPVIVSNLMNADDDLVIKPYLRPMSSMTEEEKEEYEMLQVYPGFKTNHTDLTDMYDWLNAHHFDYRGLIERGLALEAPEGMYKNE